MKSKPIKFEWEIIQSKPYFVGDGDEPLTSRTKVIGGWIVKKHNMYDDSICFVPDPKHEWVIKK